MVGGGVWGGSTCFRTRQTRQTASLLDRLSLGLWTRVQLQSEVGSVGPGHRLDLCQCLPAEPGSLVQHRDPPSSRCHFKTCVFGRCHRQHSSGHPHPTRAPAHLPSSPFNSGPAFLPSAARRPFNDSAFAKMRLLYDDSLGREPH